MKSAIQTKTDVPEGLPTLFGKMADDLTQLFDAKFTLLKIEIKEDIEAYLRGIALVLIGAVVALVGFALMNVAIAFAVSTLFQSTGFSQPMRYGMGFAITAVIYLVLGAALIIRNKNKLAAQGIMPTRSVNQIKKDMILIEEEIKE